MRSGFFSKKPLLKVLKFKNGKSIKPGGEGTFPVYGSNGVIGGSNEYREEDAIVLGRVGAYCGSIAYCPGKFWASDNTIVAYKRNNQDSVRFFSYLLREMNLNRWAGGSAQPLLTQSVLKQIETFIPSPPIQRKIASILSTYDDLVENNLRRIKILEQMAQALYREWFVKFRFPGHEMVQMVDSPLGKIPEGWEVKTLDSIMDFQGGAQPPRKEWSPEPHDGYVRMIQIRDYESDQHICFVKDSEKLRRCNKEDVMIARYGASVGRICFGLSGVYNVALVKVLPKKRYYREFLRVFLKDRYFQKMLIGMSGRTAQAGFNKTNLKSIKIAFPKDDVILQSHFQFAEPLLLCVLNIRNKIEILRQTRDLLLPKLISGELDVSDLDIDTSTLEEQSTIETDGIPNSKTQTKPTPPAEEKEVPTKNSVASIEQESTTSSEYQSPIPIDQWGTNEVLSVFRSVARDRGFMEREDFIREAAREMGYKRVGPRIDSALKGHVRAALRRRVLESNGDGLRIATQSFSDYETDELIDTLRSITRKGQWLSREEAIREAAQHLGFKRVTGRVQTALRNAIRTAILRGIFEGDRDDIWRAD